MHRSRPLAVARSNCFACCGHHQQAGNTRVRGSRGSKSKSKPKYTGPKRPVSSYLYFCKEARPTLAQDSPELKGTEVAVKLGQLWRELDKVGKAPYVELAAKDRERFETERKAFRETEVHSLLCDADDCSDVAWPSNKGKCLTHRPSKAPLPGCKACKKLPAWPKNYGFCLLHRTPGIPAAQLPLGASTASSLNIAKAARLVK